MKLRSSNEALGGLVVLEDTEAQNDAYLKNSRVDGGAGDVLKGSWFDKSKHPSIRKRASKLEFEYEDSGGSWTYADWRNHQSWSRYGS